MFNAQGRESAADRRDARIRDALPLDVPEGRVQARARERVDAVRHFVAPLGVRRCGPVVGGRIHESGRHLRRVARRARRVAHVEPGPGPPHQSEVLDIARSGRSRDLEGLGKALLGEPEQVRLGQFGAFVDGRGAHALAQQHETVSRIRRRGGHQARPVGDLGVRPVPELFGHVVGEPARRREWLVHPRRRAVAIGVDAHEPARWTRVATVVGVDNRVPHAAELVGEQPHRVLVARIGAFEGGLDARGQQRGRIGAFQRALFDTVTELHVDDRVARGGGGERQESDDGDREATASAPSPVCDRLCHFGSPILDVRRVRTSGGCLSGTRTGGARN